MAQATPTRLIENERVRVTQWHFKPGEATGWHRHEYDSVVIPVTDGQLLLKEPDGERTIESDCTTCHALLAYEEADPEILVTLRGE